MLLSLLSTSLTDFFRRHPDAATSCCGGSRPSPGSPCSRRAVRLAAFPRLASLSAAEFSEVQFVVLLRSLPKAILAYKLLAPNTEEWKQGGRRDAGMLGTRPVEVPVIDIDDATERFEFHHPPVLPGGVLMLGIVFMPFLVRWFGRMPPPDHPVSSDESFVIAYPAPLTGSFEVVADDARHTVNELHDLCIGVLVELGCSFFCIVAWQLFCLLLASCIRRAPGWLLTGPRRRRQHLIDTPVHRVTLYERSLPADAGMPPGSLQLNFDWREAQTRSVSNEVRSAVHRVTQLHRFGTFVLPRFGTFANALYAHAEEPCLSLCTLMVVLTLCLGSPVREFWSATGGPVAPCTQWDNVFTCAPMRPFAVSPHMPLINQTDTISYQLHACSADTLWADLEFTVNNATTMLQWPCVAALPTADCYLMWTLSCILLIILLALFILSAWFVHSRFVPLPQL